MYHGFRLTKRDDYFGSILTTFKSSSILEAAGAVLKIGLSLKLNHYRESLLDQICETLCPQFHQHFTCELFVRTSFRQLFLRTRNYEKFVRKMLMKLTPVQGKSVETKSSGLTLFACYNRG